MAIRIIPHSRPCLGKEEEKAVQSVIRSSLVAQGGICEKFEKELARFIGVKGAVAVNSGTSALHLGLKAMGIGKGDEVIMPSYVCAGPLNAVYQAGAKPCLCDIDPVTFNITAEAINDKMTKQVKALIVPHMFGAAADLEKIEGLGIPVIEDCAHSIGASYGSAKTGSIGKIGIFSFYANKMIACGEGGALCSNDQDILDTVRDLRDYDNKDNYKCRYNYKMADIAAAMGIEQLKKLKGFIRRRKQIAEYYNKAFKGASAVLPEGEFGHLYYRYVIRIKRDVNEFKALAAKNKVICARPVYKPLHRYFELRQGFKNTDAVYNSAVSIPIYPALSETEIRRVAGTVRDILVK